MVKLVVQNRRGKMVAITFDNEHNARKYARSLISKGIRVKGIVKVS